MLTEKRAVTDSNGKKFQCTYKLNYNAKTVSKTKSKVTCTPKATGKTVVESFYVESLGKMATVTHTVKKGKGTISKILLTNCESNLSSGSSKVYPTQTPRPPRRHQAAPTSPRPTTAAAAWPRPRRCKL